MIRRLHSSLSIAFVLGAGTVASAQTPPPAPAAPPAAPPAATAPPAPAAAAPAAAPPAAEPKPMSEATPGATPPGPPAPGAGPEKPATESVPANAWYRAIAFDAFIDAYASINYNRPKPQGPATLYPLLPTTPGGNQLRAFDVTNGFALNWAGVNASYAPDPVGATISLRAGPGARIYAGNDNVYGLEMVKQAFVSLKPGGKDGSLTIDFGKYDQPYGSEVAESQLNMNYSRSILFTYAQPLFFTGARVDYAPTSALDFKLILANGWNNSVSQNYGKTAGIQVNFKPSDTSLISAGYALGPQQCDPSAACLPGATAGDVQNLRHLADLIVDVSVDKLRFLANADFVQETVGPDTMRWFGANLGVHYSISDAFGVAARGEYFADPDGFVLGKKGGKLVDGTLTLHAKVATALDLKLEQRLDYYTSDTDDAIFLRKANELIGTQMTTMLGIVAKTN